MLQQLRLPVNLIDGKHEKIPSKTFNLFNIANNSINSTFKLKRKLDWRLELISVMEKWNSGNYLNFFFNTPTLYAVTAEVTETLEKACGASSNTWQLQERK